MRRIHAAGCWPGKAEGTVVWLPARFGWDQNLVGDRAGEVLRFRTKVARAVADLENWTDQQQTLEGRLLFQAYKEALLEPAWMQKAMSLIDGRALCASLAAESASQQVSAVMARNATLTVHAEHLRKAVQWVAGRLSPLALPVSAIVATERLLPMEVLDSQYPVLLSAAEEPCVKGQIPILWGVPDLGPEWDGCRVALDGTEIQLDDPESV